MIKRPKSNTCIVALKSARTGKIWMAADRLISWDISKAQSRVKPKIAKRNGVILAAAGDEMLLNIFVHEMQIPRFDADEDVYSYMQTRFTEAMRNVLLKKHCSDGSRNIKMPDDSDVELMVVIQGKLFSFVLISKEEPLIIYPSECNFPYAIGCGGSYAWGSLDTTEKLGIGDSKKRLELAIQSAAKNSPGCNAIYDIEKED